MRDITLKFLEVKLKICLNQRKMTLTQGELW